MRMDKRVATSNAYPMTVMQKVNQAKCASAVNVATIHAMASNAQPTNGVKWLMDRLSA